MKKILSFDFDKTLYDHHTRTVPDSALRALDALRAQGHIIVLATGRDMDTCYSKPFLEIVRPDARIDQNGAKVLAGETLLFEHFMEKELLRRMMDYAEQHQIGFGTIIGDEDYFIHPERVKDAELRRFGVCGRNFRDAALLLTMPVRTLSFIGTSAEAEEMERHFPEVTLRMFSIDYGADVIERGFSKAEGLKCLCAHYGIERKDSFAFGDSMNDYEIIREAAVGIAMGNAREELKAAADYVTSRIDEDGIWNACRHFGLIG
ncbi:MAG: Cof-type HAD-IIB family hydrolase [Stomatobaculum sp.]